jgi:hypothetical protein
MTSRREAASPSVSSVKVWMSFLLLHLLLSFEARSMFFSPVLAIRA